MTDRGTFIGNGAERGVVSQIVVSPGRYYPDDYIADEEFAKQDVSRRDER
jgi:DNA-directed RNA polymerase beta subunit